MSICWMSATTPSGVGLGMGLGRTEGSEIGADEPAGAGDAVGDGNEPTHVADARQVVAAQDDATTA